MTVERYLEIQEKLQKLQLMENVLVPEEYEKRFFDTFKNHKEYVDYTLSWQKLNLVKQPDVTIFC